MAKKEIPKKTLFGTYKETAGLPNEKNSGSVNNEAPGLTDEIASSEKDLLDSLNLPNPYPVGHPCAALYDVFSKPGDNLANKIKARNKLCKNIKVNALGNMEILGREFIVLHDEVGKRIKEKNGITYFLGKSADEKAKEQGFSFFDTEPEIMEFINQFPSTDDTFDGNVGNMFRLFRLYKPGLNNGYWDVDGKKWGLEAQAYVALGKTVPVYGIISRRCASVYTNHVTKKFVGTLFFREARHGYPAIVSKPAQK